MFELLPFPLLMVSTAHIVLFVFQIHFRAGKTGMLLHLGMIQDKKFYFLLFKREG